MSIVKIDNEIKLEKVAEDVTTVTSKNPVAMSYDVDFWIQKAIDNGCIVRGFRSGGGLRVVRIEYVIGEKSTLQGYGEHPNIEDALKHAVEDYCQGTRPYNEVYGKIYDKYLTGSSEVSSPLDRHLLKGGTFRVRSSDIGIFVDLFDLVNGDSGARGSTFSEAVKSAFVNALVR